jgi:hypothetical protein
VAAVPSGPNWNPPPPPQLYQFKKKIIYYLGTVSVEKAEILASQPLVSKSSSFEFRIAIISPNGINPWLFLGGKNIAF